MISIVMPLVEGRMEEAKQSSVRNTALPKPAMLVDDGEDTSVTIKSTDGGSDVRSAASSSCCSVMSHGSSNSEVRRRYLHRLGILSGPDKHPAPYAGMIGGTSLQDSPLAMAVGGSQAELQSCSAPEKRHPMKRYQRHNSSRTSSSDGDAIPVPTFSGPRSARSGSEEANIILLKRSVQYTTKLKSSPAKDNDVDKLSQAISKTSLQDDDNATDDGTSSSKFELSSAWTSFLSKDTATTRSIDSTEPLDGAYDLFSLPSDSSATSASRCDSTRSLDNITTLDRLNSRDDLSASSMPRSRQRKVSFDSTVKATTIPSRLSYSNRIRTRLWSSTEDIYANAVRNEREYAYDGSNWRKCREEADFLRCSSNSSCSSQETELVHPVHFSGSWSPHQAYWQDGQTTSMSSQQKQRPTSAKNEESSNVLDDQVDNSTDYTDGMFEMD